MSSNENLAPTESEFENKDELGYLQLIREILAKGSKRDDRTGVGTVAVFGSQLRYSLRDGTFPLLTTKKVFFRGIAEELLQFLDSCGFTDREEGDLGPVYGFQWRHFGATYETCHDDYRGKGKDQLAEVIDKIKNNPTDRRISLSWWYVHPIGALPPCHCLAQFFVANGELSCQMFQNSADVGLGIPFTIASYSLLTHMIAHVTGLKAGEFIHATGDTHIYLNHIDALKEQVQRTPRKFPTLTFKREVASIEDFQYDDFIINDYNPYPLIRMEMAV